MVTASFSGSSSYRAELIASVSGSSVTATLSVDKLSGSGFWTASPYDYGLSISGTSYGGTWTYDFRDYNSKTVRTATKNTGYVGSVTANAWVEMGSGIGRAPSSGSMSVTVTVADSPDAPPTPSVGTVTYNSIALSWGAASNNGDSIDEYQIQRATNSSFSSGVSTASTGTTRSYTFSGLASADTYYFRVRAKNGKGWGPWSSTRTQATDAAPPNAPTGLELAVVGVGQVEATWTLSTSNGGKALSGHDVQYSLSSSFSSPTTVSVGGSATSAVLSGLTSGATYYVRVRAKNVDNAGAWSTSKSIVAGTAPEAPVPVITDATATMLAASWSAPANGGLPILEYQAQISASSDFSSPTTLSTGTNPAAVFGDLTRMTTYYIRARARNGIGWGAWSASVSGVTKASGPSAPLSPVAERVAYATIGLNWSPPSDDGGKPIIGYDVQYSISADFSSGGILTVPGLSTLIAGPGPVGRLYYMRVRAKNDDGAGAWSATASAIASAGTKVWDGAAWVPAPLRAWDGSLWDPSTVKVWDGTTWKVAR